MYKVALQLEERHFTLLQLNFTSPSVSYSLQSISLFSCLSLPLPQPPTVCLPASLPHPVNVISVGWCFNKLSLIKKIVAPFDSNGVLNKLCHDRIIIKNTQRRRVECVDLSTRCVCVHKALPQLVLCVMNGEVGWRVCGRIRWYYVFTGESQPHRECVCVCSCFTSTLLLQPLSSFFWSLPMVV